MEPPPWRHGSKRPDRDAPTRVAVVVVAGVLSILMFLLLRSCSRPALVPPAAPYDTTSVLPERRLAAPLHFATAAGTAMTAERDGLARARQFCDRKGPVASRRRDDTSSADRGAPLQLSGSGVLAKSQKIRCIPPGAPPLPCP